MIFWIKNKIMLLLSDPNSNLVMNALVWDQMVMSGREREQANIQSKYILIKWIFKEKCNSMRDTEYSVQMWISRMNIMLYCHGDDDNSMRRKQDGAKEVWRQKSALQNGCKIANDYACLCVYPRWSPPMRVNVENSAST